MDSGGKKPAASDPNSKTIGIDFDTIQKAVPESTPGAPGKPGLAIVWLLHEKMHIDQDLPTNPCNEITITVVVAAWHCEFICTIQAAGGGPLDALCKLYRHVKYKYKEYKQQYTDCAGPSEIPGCNCCN
jgi:hypothetical protein